MKKTLIALAVLAVSGAAFAQSTVTIGGKANIGVQKSSFNAAVPPALQKDKLMANDGPDGSNSRLFFTGSEDLGGGLKANFHMEQQVSLGDGSTQAATFARQAWMGVSGGFGEIRAGRQYTLGFTSSIGYMPSTSTTAQVVFANNAKFGTVAVPASAAGVTPVVAAVAEVTPTNGNNYFNTVASRNDAQLRYTSPSFGGVRVSAATQLTGNTATPLTEVQVAYAAGPLSASLYTSKTKNTPGNNLGLNAGYNLDVAKIVGGYVDRAGAGAGKGYFFGGSVPMGALTVGAVYANNSDTKVAATELYGRYALSKRTTAYTHFRTGSKLPVKSLLAIGLDHNF